MPDRKNNLFDNDNLEIENIELKKIYTRRWRNNKKIKKNNIFNTTILDTKKLEYFYFFPLFF